MKKSTATYKPGDQVRAVSRCYGSAPGRRTPVAIDRGAALTVTAVVAGGSYRVLDGHGRTLEVHGAFLAPGGGK